MMLVLGATILIDPLHRKKAALRKIVQLEEAKKHDVPHKSMYWSYSKPHTSQQNSMTTCKKLRSCWMLSLSST